MSPLELKEHQRGGITWLRHVKRGLLADPPRTGKTAQALLAAEGKTLVVAPAFLEGTWAEQQKLWQPNLDLTFVGYSSLAARRTNEQGRRANAVPVPRSEYRGHWDTVILDECHMVKNPKANWTGAVTKLDYHRLYMMTGTPITNWAHELLMLLRLLFPGDRRFTNRQKWLNEWFNLEWNPHSRSLKPVIHRGDPNHGLNDRHTWAEFMEENGLNERMLMRDVDLDVPLTEETIECPMTATQRKVYNELKEHYVAWTEEGAEISAWSDGGLHTKLARIASGLEVEDPGSRGSGKFNVLLQILAGCGTQATLLFCHFRATAEALAGLCQELGLSYQVIRGGVKYEDRDKIRQRFQNGELQVLIGTIDTVAVGLTLSRATTLIMVEHSWTPWKNDQAAKRALELGKTAHTHIIHLYTPKTVDTGMRRMLKSKSEQQIAALSAHEFREILNG